MSSETKKWYGLKITSVMVKSLGKGLGIRLKSAVSIASSPSGNSITLACTSLVTNLGRVNINPLQRLYPRDRKSDFRCCYHLGGHFSLEKKEKTALFFLQFWSLDAGFRIEGRLKMLGFLKK